jgi:Protein of unknown function (DUF2783)
MTLNRNPNIPDPDGFYEALIAAQRDLSDERADMLLAKLVLILANHIGDRAVLDQALALARDNTLAAATSSPSSLS